MTTKRFLQFRNHVTGEIEMNRRIDVTRKGEREIAQIERGMLINIGPDWLVDDVTEES